LPDGARKWVFTNTFQVRAISPDETLILTDEGTGWKLWKIEGEEVRSLLTFGPKRNPSSERNAWSGAAFSPDGRLAATAEENGLIKLWAMPAAREVGIFSGHTRNQIDLAFSPDGRTLASICDDRTVRLWHVATRRELLRFQALKEDQRQFALVFSPDGRALAARRFDEDGPITWVWHAPSLAEIAVAEEKH
jgi:WD40 repeat protein